MHSTFGRLLNQRLYRSFFVIFYLNVAVLVFNAASWALWLFRLITLVVVVVLRCELLAHDVSNDVWE